MSRRTLRRLFLCFASLGAALATIPFAVSLKPGEQVLAARPRVAMPKLASGEFAFVRDPTWNAGELMFVRQADGRLDVWHVARVGPWHALPDGQWWRPGLPCRDFGPKFAQGIIGCADTDLPELARHQYSWTLDGKSLSPPVADLAPVIGFAEGGDYVLGSQWAKGWPGD